MEDKVTLKDIYAGKPDAKDEIITEGFEKFVNSFIVPSNFDLEFLVNNSNYFITGYKGTGKTALLFYLDDYIKKMDESSCSTFIFFKEDFEDTKRQELEILSKRLISSIDISRDIQLEGLDYEHIWRWIFFKKIIEANESYNGGLFINDNKWDEFVKTIKRVFSESNRKKFISPNKLKFTFPYVDMATMSTITPEIEVDLQNKDNLKEYRLFTHLIDEAEILFKQLKRTDVPYYIFVDELEAYYGDQKTFKRDLLLIRDLIFTVRRLNSIFLNNADSKTKIICSVRTEIINAISRFIVTKELNKVISGFGKPLVWDYNNTNSFEHPIMKILVRRIGLAKYLKEGTNVSDKEICAEWFPEKIYGIEPANYILNNTWNKPRDIVRLISATQTSLSNNSSAFTQSVFDSCQGIYSIDSLTEIKEEMIAIYSPEQSESIFNCLTGFRATFSLKQLQDWVKRYYSDSILATNMIEVLRDLYRLGVIGNYSRISKAYRWQHRGDDGIIISDQWQIMVHRALQNALSINNKNVKEYDPLSSQLRAGDILKVTVKRVLQYIVFVEFEYDGRIQKGSIHIKQLSNSFISNIFEFAKEGDEFDAKILKYNEQYNSWDLSLKI